MKCTIINEMLPDTLISGGNLNDYKNSNNTLRKSSLNSFYSTVWHELTHASNFRRVRNEKGVVYADFYWNSVVSTEVGHNISSGGGSPYGNKGDSNWELIALVEGWAHYIQRKMINKYLLYPITRSGFPWTYYNMFDELVGVGCSLQNIEKSLIAKNISEFKSNLINTYPSLKTIIDSKIKPYE